MCMQFPQPPCSTTVHVPSNARQNRIDTPTKQEVLKGLSLPLLRLLLHWGVSCSFSSSSPNGAVMFVPPRSQETWHCSSFRYACSLQPPEQLTSTGKLWELSSGWNAFQVLLQGDRASRWRLFQNSSQAKQAVYI